MSNPKAKTGEEYVGVVKIEDVVFTDIDWTNPATFTMVYNTTGVLPQYVTAPAKEVKSSDSQIIVKMMPTANFVSADITLKVKTKKNIEGSGVLHVTRTGGILPPPPTPGEPALVLPSAATQVEGDKPMAVEFVVKNAVSEDIKSPMATAGGSWDVAPFVAFARDIVSGDTVMALKGTPKKGFGSDTVLNY